MLCFFGCFFKYGVHLVGSWFSFCGECSQDLFLHWRVLSPLPATQWLVLRSRSAREKSLEILRRDWELNPGHRENRQWAIPLSYHDWLCTQLNISRVVLQFGAGILLPSSHSHLKNYIATEPSHYSIHDQGVTPPVGRHLSQYRHQVYLSLQVTMFWVQFGCTAQSELPLYDWGQTFTILVFV